MGDGITHAGISDALDRSGEVANFACTKHTIVDQRVRCHIAGFHNGEFRTGRHQLNGIPDLDGAFFDADIDDNALIGIIIAVEDQSLQRSVRIALGCRNVRHNFFHDSFDVDACLCGDPRGIFCGNPDHIFDLLADTVRICSRQVDLVDNRHYFQIVFDCQISICQCLGFDAL